MSGYSTTGSNAFFGGIHEPRGSLLLGVTDRGVPRPRHPFRGLPTVVPENNRTRFPKQYRGVLVVPVSFFSFSEPSRVELVRIHHAQPPRAIRQAQLQSSLSSRGATETTGLELSSLSDCQRALWN